jgi:MFS family permease
VSDILERRASPGRYRDVLAIRRYRWLWLGDTVSSLGDSVSFVALVWLVYETSGSSGTVGWFVAAYTAPVLVGGPFVGAVLDRFDRRRLLIADNVVRAGLIALVPLLHLGGVLELWQLYVVAIVYGLLRMFPLAGVPALIPDLVPDDRLEAANALETVSYFLSAVIGAAVAGVLVAAVGAASTLWLDAASYVFFALALWRMGRVPTAPAARGEEAASIRAAVRFVAMTPVLVATTLMFMLVNVGEGILQVVLPVYVREVLDAGPATYGALVSVAAAAGVLGALAAGLSAGGLPLGRAIAVSEILAGLAFAALAGTPGLALALFLFALGSLFLGPLTVWAQTIRMRFIPPDMRGRVFGLLRTLMQSTVPLGALLAAPLLGRGGVPAAALVVGALCVLPALAALVTGSLDRDRPQTVTRGPGRPAGQSASVPDP